MHEVLSGGAAKELCDEVGRDVADAAADNGGGLTHEPACGVFFFKGVSSLVLRLILHGVAPLLSLAFLNLACVTHPRICIHLLNLTRFVAQNASELMHP
jgi:hypothetical protein